MPYLSKEGVEAEPLGTRRARLGSDFVITKYDLHVPEAVARLLRQCRAPVRRALEARLEEIAIAAAERRSGARRKTVAAAGPPLRFYIHEAYRVLYRVDTTTRRIVVLDLRSETS